MSSSTKGSNTIMAHFRLFSPLSCTYSVARDSRSWSPAIRKRSMLPTPEATRAAVGDAFAGGVDARDWDEDGYRRSILRERELQYRTVFRTAFAPSPNPNPETIVIASSDGSIAAYSISSCVAATSQHTYLNKINDQNCILESLLVEPCATIQGHRGPAYDLKFYERGEKCLLISCGDDGRIRAWNWKELLKSDIHATKQGQSLKTVLDLVNPQHEGPWGALSPIPENNAISVDEQEGCIFSAAGDNCAYCWDMESGKQKLVLRGHSDYLHCITSCKSSSQVITGSEDGTARIWDRRSGTCTKVIHPEKGHRLKETSWISSVATDERESWLACGSGIGLSLWSLLSFESIFSVDSHAPVQDLVFDDNNVLAVGAEPILTRYGINGDILSQIKCAPLSAFSVSLHPSRVVAVGGYGGLVDIISQFGSHLSTFRCPDSNQPELMQVLAFQLPNRAREFFPGIACHWAFLTVTPPALCS